MEPLATIRLELGINAQRLISQFQTNNKQLEEVVTKGVERALKEVLEDDNFENIVVATVKEEIMQTVKNAASDWNVRHKIHEAISKAVEKKIDNAAAAWADKALKNLDE